MKEIIEEILKQLINKNFKLKFINRIELINRFNIGTSSFEDVINIEVLRHDYKYKYNLSKILTSDYNIEVTYGGEYTGERMLPKNMWVKMNEDEKEHYLKQQNPCKGCVSEDLEIVCDIKLCDFLKDYTN
jgi:hypothetical protein